MNDRYYRYISLWMAAVSAVLGAGAASADKPEICFADGPYRAVGDEPRIDVSVLKQAISDTANDLGFNLVTQSGWDCRASDKAANECLKAAKCHESLYIDVKEEASAFTYSIVSLKRGKLVNMTGAIESELLDSLKQDLRTLLDRPSKYEYQELEQKLGQNRKIDPEPEGPDPGQIAKYNRLKILTIVAGAATIVSLGVSIGTGIAGTSLYDDIVGAEPMDRTQEDIDKFGGLSLASHVSMGLAVFTGITTGILLPLTLRQKRLVSHHSSESAAQLEAGQAGPVSDKPYSGVPYGLSVASLGTTGALAITSVILTAAVENRHAALLKMRSGFTDLDEGFLDESKRLQNVATGMWIATGAMGAVTVVLYVFTDWDRFFDRKAARLDISAQGVSLTF